MTGLLLLVLIAAWGLVSWLVDRPLIPAFHRAKVWKLVALISLVCLAACLTKTLAYRTELRALMPYCR